MKLVKTLSSATLLSFAVMLGGCSSDDDSSAPGTQSQMSILDTAEAAGSFTTLTAAVEAAGLTSTLDGPGPFTVFAPTDDAFAALPAGTVDTLLKPENKQQLADILTYHVISGEVRASQVVELTSADTVNGGMIGIEVKDGNVILNGNVKVTQTDIEASNGVIHVLDAVLLPPSN